MPNLGGILKTYLLLSSTEVLYYQPLILSSNYKDIYKVMAVNIHIT